LLERDRSLSKNKLLRVYVTNNSDDDKRYTTPKNLAKEVNIS